MKYFERIAALVFLVILIGLVAFLTFVPLPVGSEKVILMIIGGLMTTAAVALPKLFGVDDPEKENFKKRVVALEAQLAVTEAHLSTLQAEHRNLVALLIERHVVKGEGFEHAKLTATV